MIKQVIHIKTYWTIIVYYNVDYNRFYVIEKDLRRIDTPLEDIGDIIAKMESNYAKGVSITNPVYKTSIVLINKHCNKYDFINTIFHEVYHVHSAIFKYYSLTLNSEPAAELIGYIIEKMYRVFKVLL